MWVLRIVPCVALIMFSFPMEVSAGDDRRRAALPESHRSSSGVHKLLVFADDSAALERLGSDGTVLRTIDYGNFKLLFVNDVTMGLLAEPELRRVQVRDSFDLVGLNGWTADTRIGEPGDLAESQRQSPAVFPWQLYVVQFIGPIREAWLTDLTQLGDVQVVGYLPNNAYLVRATPSAWARLDSGAGNPTGAIQWVGVYQPAYRIDATLAPVIADGTAAADVVVQVVDSPEGQSAAERILQDALQVHDAGTTRGGRRNLRVRIPGDSIIGLAHDPGVTWIEPLHEARPADERQDQIVAGNVVVQKGAEQPASVGYWPWLEGRELTCSGGAVDCDADGVFTGLVVDVTDLGFDKGDLMDVPFPDFFAAQNSTRRRLAYIRNYVPGLNEPGKDVVGHGTVVASVVASYNLIDQVGFEDTNNYQYGLGVAPAVLLGATKAFEVGFPSATNTEEFVEDAYRGGARVSNNSWVKGQAGDYTALAQDYDMLVRDADSNSLGNQQMTFVFVSGNTGQGANVKPPGTAKNIITVGASESYRKFLPAVDDDTSCGAVTDADDARDVAAISLRGPTTDQRTKPDIVAPGTRIIGRSSRENCDPLNPPGDPRCDNPVEECVIGEPPCCCEDSPALGCGFIREPTPSTRRYMVAQGTSLAAPAVSGAAALVLQHFKNQVPAWDEPSPAMIKAFLLATTTYLTGDGGNDTLPSNNQGYGRVNLGRAFDGTVNQRVDQDPNLVFTSSGQLYTLNGSVATVSKPFRVVLAWTDHPGTLGGNAWVNDLNLEVFVEDVEGDYLLYHGNHFSGSESVCFEVIGVPPPRPECANPVLDGRNNVEAVFLPAGFLPGGTSYQIRVRAMIIADDAVPGIGVEGDPDQDFALFVYNGTP